MREHKNYNISDEDRDYIMIKEIYDYLSEERGVYLMDHIPDRNRDKIFAIAKLFPGLKGSSVLEGEENRIYFRINRLNPGYKASIEYQKAAEKAFAEGHYDEAIENLKDIIEKYSYLNSNVFELLGLSYLKKKENEKAVPYLIIATYISSIENPNRNKDYSSLINLITGEYRKSYTKYNESEREERFYGREFMINESNNYGIVNVKAIREYAIKNHVTMEEAGDAFKLTDEQKDLLKLIVAREYYKDGNYKQGDLYLNNVEATRKKTDRVFEVLSEVRAKKPFYKYRNDSKEKVLTYIKPGKRNYE